MLPAERITVYRVADVSARRWLGAPNAQDITLPSIHPGKARLFSLRALPAFSLIQKVLDDEFEGDIELCSVCAAPRIRRGYLLSARCVDSVVLVDRHQPSLSQQSTRRRLDKCGVRCHQIWGNFSSRYVVLIFHTSFDSCWTNPMFLSKGAPQSRLQPQATSLTSLQKNLHNRTCISLQGAAVTVYFIPDL